jgi:hypothetical protein
VPPSPPHASRATKGTARARDRIALSEIG